MPRRPGKHVVRGVRGSLAQGCKLCRCWFLVVVAFNHASYRHLKPDSLPSEFLRKLLNYHRAAEEHLFGAERFGEGNRDARIYVSGLNSSRILPVATSAGSLDFSRYTPGIEWAVSVNVFKTETMQINSWAVGYPSLNGSGENMHPPTNFETSWQGSSIDITGRIPT